MHHKFMKCALTAFLVLLLGSHATGEDCRKAVDLYNRAITEENLRLREDGFKKAIPLCSDPEIVSRVYNNLADTYEKGGRFSLAFNYYRKALEAKPDLATSYFSVGDIYFRLKDYYSAVLMYKKGLKYRPDDEESLKRKEAAELKARRHMVIYFDFDSSRIPDRYLKRLGFLKQYVNDPGEDAPAEILVIGHTCSLGPKIYNRKLSIRRAEAVARYLKGILSGSSISVRVMGKGEDVPLLPGSDRNAMTLNRRVEVKVYFSRDLADGRVTRIL